MKLDVRLFLRSTAFAVGEPVLADIAITNTGETPARIPLLHSNSNRYPMFLLARPSRGSELRINSSGIRAIGDAITADDNPHARTLDPGRAYTGDFLVNPYADLTEPDIYELSMETSVDEGLVRSNVARLSVECASSMEVGFVEQSNANGGEIDLAWLFHGEDLHALFRLQFGASMYDPDGYDMIMLKRAVETGPEAKQLTSAIWNKNTPVGKRHWVAWSEANQVYVQPEILWNRAIRLDLPPGDHSLAGIPMIDEDGSARLFVIDNADRIARLVRIAHPERAPAPPPPEPLPDDELLVDPFADLDIDESDEPVPDEEDEDEEDDDEESVANDDGWKIAATEILVTIPLAATVCGAISMLEGDADRQCCYLAATAQEDADLVVYWTAVNADGGEVISATAVIPDARFLPATNPAMVADTDGILHVAILCTHQVGTDGSDSTVALLATLSFAPDGSTVVTATPSLRSLGSLAARPIAATITPRRLIENAPQFDCAIELEDGSVVTALRGGDLQPLPTHIAAIRPLSLMACDDRTLIAVTDHLGVPGIVAIR